MSHPSKRANRTIKTSENFCKISLADRIWCRDVNGSTQVFLVHEIWSRLHRRLITTTTIVVLRLLDHLQTALCRDHSLKCPPMDKITPKRRNTTLMPASIAGWAAASHSLTTSAIKSSLLASSSVSSTSPRLPYIPIPDAQTSVCGGFSRLLDVSQAVWCPILCFSECFSFSYLSNEQLEIFSPLGVSRHHTGLRF